MKLITLTSSIILTCGILCGCSGNKNKSNAGVKSHSNQDDRPKDEITFLNRIKAEYIVSSITDTSQKGAHIAAFDQYAEDNLKKITDWEMIVTEVNDDTSHVSSFVRMFFKKDNDIYNVVLVAPIKIDNSVDNVAPDNSVYFTYTILKNPGTDLLKKRVDYIQTLQKGDTVLVSGRLIHIDNKGKITYAPFYNQHQPWNIDLMPTVLKKKSE